MEFMQTVQLTKKLKNGKELTRYWDLIKNSHGFCIQRNGRTVYGRLSGYGSQQIFNDLVQSDLENNWKKEDDDYNHLYKDVILNAPPKL